MQPSTNTMPLGLQGLWLGAQAGAVLSWLYITALISSVFRIPLQELFIGNLTGELFVLLAAVIISAVVIEMMPAMIIGGIMDWLLGRLIDSYFAVLSRDRATLLGFSLCILSSVALCSACWVAFVGGSPFNPSKPSYVRGFLLLLGCPAMLYIPMGGWVADRLYLLRSRLNR
jgi:hypothetical protein